MKKYGLIALLFFTASLSAQELDVFFNKADIFFSANVKDGEVAYSKIKSNPEPLDELLKLASTLSVDKSNANVYKAFWINTYNLLTIKGIVRHYPLKSPLDVSGFFDSVTYNVAGTSITLNGIENDLLRANFKDPRFHFVLVCGAVGCPPLIAEAYKPKRLDAQMDEQTKKAINGNFLKVNDKKKEVGASEIMKWYNEDFTLNSSTEIDFINTYRTEKIPSNYKVTFFPYNWNLNKQ